MLLKSYHWMDLEEFFSRDTLPIKTKLNERGILNLDPSSGDGTHWVMWFKKGKTFMSLCIDATFVGK